MEEGEARTGAPSQVVACSWLELGGLLLETAASLTRCLRTYCSIVVFTGPGLCLLSPRRRTRSPGTTEGDPPCAWRKPVGTPAQPLVQ